MKFIDIAVKDLYQIFKDWKPAIFLVIAPIAFTLMFGFMFGGFSGPNQGNDDDRLPVQFVSSEQSPVTDSFRSYLEDSEVIRIESVDPDTALTDLEQLVADQDIAGVIILPEGFSQAVREKENISLKLIVDESSMAGVTVKQEIQTAVSRLQAAADAGDLAVRILEEKQGITGSLESQVVYDEAFSAAIKAWNTPPVTSVETQTASGDDPTSSDDNAFAQSLPGMMAQFAIAGLIGAGEIIVQERKSGALGRLKSTNVSNSAILSGHWLAIFIMIFMQFFIMIIFGQLFLRLDFFAAPAGTLLLSIASCAFVASLGLLIGILAKMPEQTAVFALIPMFIFSGLGGAWMPLEILGETVQQVARFIPLSWIISGYKDILLRGAGFTQSVLPAVILLGFSVLFFVPAAILFNRQDQ
jgi:ABC-2 type transport system permease protein